MKKTADNYLKPFILTDFDVFRARFRESCRCLVMIVVMDILLLLFAWQKLSPKNSWLIFIPNLILFINYVVSAVLFQNKKKKETKLVLWIDDEGILLPPHQKITWSNIRTVYLSRHKGDDILRGLYLYVERKNGSIIGLNLFLYYGVFSVYHLKQRLLDFAAGQTTIKVEAPLWLYW